VIDAGSRSASQSPWPRGAGRRRTSTDYRRAHAGSHSLDLTYAVLDRSAAGSPCALASTDPAPRLSGFLLERAESSRISFLADDAIEFSRDGHAWSEIHVGLGLRR